MKKLLIFLSILVFLNIASIKSAGKSDAAAAIAVQPEIKKKAESVESKAEIKESVESEFRKILREKTPLPEVLFKVIQDYCQKFVYFQTLDVNSNGYGVAYVKYLPDGSLISSTYDGTIKIWIKTATGLWKHFQTLNYTKGGHANVVRFIKYLPDDGSLVSCSDDNTIKIWIKNAAGLWRNVQTLNHTNGGHANVVRFIKYLPNDGSLVSCSDDRTIKIWIKNAAGLWELSQTLNHTNGGHTNDVNLVKNLPDGSLVSCSDDAKIKVWVKNTAGLWKLSQTLDHNNLDHNNNGHNRVVWPRRVITFVKYLPDRSLVSYSYDGKIKVWIKDAGTDLWENVQTLNHTNGGHTGPVNLVKYFPDGSLVSCSFDSTIKIWIKDVATGLWKNVQTIETNNCYAVRFVKYLPNGSLVSCSGITIKIWSKSADALWSPIQTLEGHVDRINLIRHLPDGSLVSCSDDGKIKIWKLTADFSKNKN